MSDYSKESYFRNGLHLWRSVIFHSIMEAQGKMAAVAWAKSAKQRVKAQKWLQRDAIEYLTTDNSDLRLIFEWCAFDDMTYEEFLASNQARFGGGK